MRTEKYRLTLNESKIVSAVQTLPILGYLVSKGEIKPDPERLRLLRNLGAPFNLDSQRRIVGMFAYYSKWILKFSEKIRPLSTNRVFPLPQEALTTFESLKEEIANATLVTVNGDHLLEVETDASDYAIPATLNQGGRVAFFSRTLTNSNVLIAPCSTSFQFRCSIRKRKAKKNSKNSRGQFFFQKTAKNIFAPNCALIFDPLPRAHKSKLGRAKKYTPGELKLEHPKWVRMCAPKLQFETTKN